MKKRKYLQKVKKGGCYILAAAMFMTAVPAGLAVQTLPVYADDAAADIMNPVTVADTAASASAADYFKDKMTAVADTDDTDTQAVLSDEFETEEPEAGEIVGWHWIDPDRYTEYTGADGVKYWYYDNDDGTVGIYAYDIEAEEITVPQTIDGKRVISIGNYHIDGYETNTALKKATLPDGLKEIGDAFYNCVNLETVVVPDSVETIGHGAFYGTHSLNEIHWPKNLKTIGGSAFRYSTISSAILPEGLVEIGSSAFEASNAASTEPGSDYAQLKELVIPSTVEKIGERAFLGQGRINSTIQLPAGLKEIGSWAFAGASVSGDIIFPEGMTYIPGYVFFASRIASVTIPEGVTEIWKEAFGSCLYLTDVSLPDSLTTICEGAFSLDEKLSITVPKNVTMFETNTTRLNEQRLPDVFFGVKSVTFAAGNPMYCSDNTYIYNKEKTTLCTAYRWDQETYTVPSGIRTIGYNAFKNTKKVKSVVIPDSVTAIDDFAFLLSSLPQVVIPDSVTRLGEGAFSSCEELAQITISKNLTEIPDNAFGGAFALESIVIPDNITKIGIAAFSTCRNLTNVTLSKNLKTIGHHAFSGCAKLTDITLPDSLVEIDKEAFSDTDLRVVEIPENVEVLEGAFSGLTLTSVILNEKIKTLTAIQPLAGNKFIIPGSVEKIENASFHSTTAGNAEWLAIPGSVTSIEGSIFSGAENMKNVWIENTSLAFGDNVFYDINSSAGIYKEGGIYGYEGSTAQQEAQKAGLSFFAVSRKDCGNGNAVTYAASEFTENVTPAVTAIDSASDTHRQLSSMVNTDFAAYQVSFTGQSGQLSPSAMVKASISLPQGYELSKCHAYVLNADGELEMLQMDKTNGELSFWVNDGGSIVVTQSALRNTMEYKKNYRVKFYELRDYIKYLEEYVVKEGDTVQAPEWTYQCHALSWDYDFSHITEDVEIHPVWTESHEWDTEYTIDKSATTTQEGQKSIHCKVHKDVIKEDSIVKLPKLVADGVSKGDDGELHYYTNNQIVEDYTGFASDGSGKKYWFDDGTVAREKQVYDQDSKGWYWFDADGTMAVDKDVFVPKSNEDRSEGKWVRYDANGHMIKGEDYRYGGWYRFDEITGEMVKGFCTVQNGEQSSLYYYNNYTGQMEYGAFNINGIEYAFDDSTGIAVHMSWYYIDGNAYWYENGVRQGMEGRGKEIYDPVSDGWYWLDAIDGGKKAVSKDVYQESYAGAYADREDGTGKWVRYDADGRMIKGWSYQNGNRYYFDLETGAMAKGSAYIDGSWYYFNPNTGVLES